MIEAAEIVLNQMCKYYLGSIISVNVEQFYYHLCNVGKQG